MFHQWKHMKLTSNTGMRGLASDYENEKITYFK